MDFNDQRRMFMNMGGHPLVGNHSGLENPQVGQQESQQTPHSRLLLPTSSLSHTPLETTMTTMSMASLSSHMALTNPHLPMHLNLPHSSHIQQEQLTQAPPHPQHPTPHAPLQVPVIPPQVEETDETNNIVKNIKAQVPDSEPENEPELEEANEDESENEERWCLICNSNLPSFSQQQSEEDIIYLFHASMTISKRKLSGMLSRLVDLSENRTHSNVLCRRCFSLIEQIDGLEIELAGSKMELVQQYESTLTARHLATSDSKPIMDIEADWEESEEDAPEDTELSGKKRNRKAKRKGFPRKISNLADSKVTLEMDDDMMGMEEDGSEELKPFNVRRNRGRPKKIKEEEDSTNTQANPKECPNCGKTLPPQKYLKHLSSSHKMHPCPFCDTVLKRKVRKSKVRHSSKLPVLDRDGLVKSLSKLDVRTIMKYLVLEGKNPYQIHKELSGTISDMCVDLKTVKRWVSSFQLGKASVDDKPRTGRPSTGRSNEHIKSVEDLIKEDPRITIQKMSDVTGVTKTTIHRIIHVDLGKRWINGKWITRVLSEEERIERSTKKAQKGTIRNVKKESKEQARPNPPNNFNIPAPTLPLSFPENKTKQPTYTSSPPVQSQGFSQSFLYPRPMTVAPNTTMPANPNIYSQHYSLYSQQKPLQHFSPPQPPF